MKISDLIISAIAKHGIAYEARNVNTDITIPIADEKFIVINFKCDSMKVSLKEDIKK